MNGVIKNLAARFSEPSSWAGIAGVLAAAGFHFPSGTVQSLTYVCAGVAGLVAFFMPDSASK